MAFLKLMLSLFLLGTFGGFIIKHMGRMPTDNEMLCASVLLAGFIAHKED